MSIKFEEKVEDIITNAIKYHSDYNVAETFYGPNLYFHRKSLEAKELGTIPGVYLRNINIIGYTRLGQRWRKHARLQSF